jgi:hypothetical protein
MRRIVSVVLLSSAFAAVAEAQPGAAEKALERLRQLAGRWEGTLEWSGARSGTGTVEATYALTGNGTAVVEHLTMNGSPVPSMSSVYHLDGADLRMTHYCAANNQPRLKASRIDEAGGVIEFSFVDGTNLAARPAHVHAVELRFPGQDRLVIRFTFAGGDKTSLEHIELKRVPAAPMPR